MSNELPEADQIPDADYGAGLDPGPAVEEDVETVAEEPVDG